MTGVASPTIDEMTGRILGLYQDSSEETRFLGATWYDEARAFAHALADRHGVTMQVAACVLAAHSMNAKWWQNKVRAEKQLCGHPAGLGHAIRMAAAAIANPADPFRFIVGPKLNPFAHNIAGDESFVATDRWAQRAGFGTDEQVVCERFIRRGGVRDDLIAAYGKAAAEVGVTPAVMQAIVWVHVRGSAV